MDHIGSGPPGRDQLTPWYTATTAEILGRPVQLWTLPGVVGAGASFTALQTATGQLRAARAFVAGPGALATAVWAVGSGLDVLHWTDSVAESLSLRKTFAENGLPCPETYAICGFEALAPASCQVALVHLPRGRAPQAELLQAAAAVLEPGGKLVFVGARDEGVKGATDEARRRFGGAGIVFHKGGYHAGVARNPAEPTPFPEITFRTHPVVLDGEPARLVSCDGVFAHDRLDGGAAALIRAMSVAPNTDVLDLGCGTGLVGLAALRRGARTAATDVSARAVATTRRTWEANGYQESAVALCPGATALPNATVDTVVANPPFHRGHDTDFAVAKLFVVEAARVLRPAGALYLVANAFLDYGKWLRPRFRTVDIAQADAHFRVWYAVR